MKSFFKEYGHDNHDDDSLTSNDVLSSVKASK